MEIYTIIIQFLNFFLLLLILNKFLFKPLLKLIDDKKKLIDKQMNEIENNLSDSEELKIEYLNKNKQIESEKDLIKQKIDLELSKYKEEELIKISKEIETEKLKIKDQFEIEKNGFIKDFNKNIMDIFIEYSNSVLKSLSNTNLQDQIINKFFEKINLLSSEKIDSFNQNIQSKTISIYSSAEIEDKNKEIIKKFLTEKGINFNNIQYFIDTNLILGIELKASSNVISWNIKEINEDFILKLSKNNSL